MTKDEQKAEIGGIVLEKKELERQLACVNNKLHRFRIVFEKSIEAINGVVNWKCSGEGEEMSVVFPIGDESLPSYCQMLCMETSGGDLILPDSVDEFHIFNDLTQAAIAL